MKLWLRRPGWLSAPDVATTRSGWARWCLACWIGLVGAVAVATAVDPPAHLDRVAAVARTGPVRAVTVPDAPAAVPVRVAAPAVGIDAPLLAVGLTGDGALDVPPFGSAGWFAPGPRPGAPGPAVIAGHVDSYDGPDVFFRLADLQPGDEITVTGDDATTTTFVVDAVETAAKDELPTQRIWDAGDAARLRLITCGGSFDRATRSYRSNVIVYASAAADLEQLGVRASAVEASAGAARAEGRA